MPKKFFPEFVIPMTASVAKKPFNDPDWIFETKLDGYRGNRGYRLEWQSSDLVSKSITPRTEVPYCSRCGGGTESSQSILNYFGGTKLNSGNIVRDLKLTDNLDGIFLVGATVSRVTNNQIINSNSVGRTGIYIAGGSNVASGNIINGFSAGLAFGNSYLFENTISNCNTGLFMQGSDKYRFNTTFSCNIPFSGGTVLTSDITEGSSDSRECRQGGV